MTLTPAWPFSHLALGRRSPLLFRPSAFPAPDRPSPQSGAPTTVPILPIAVLLFPAAPWRPNHSISPGPGPTTETPPNCGSWPHCCPRSRPAPMWSRETSLGGRISTSTYGLSRPPAATHEGISPSTYDITRLLVGAAAIPAGPHPCPLWALTHYTPLCLAPISPREPTSLSLRSRPWLCGPVGWTSTRARA